MVVVSADQLFLKKTANRDVYQRDRIFDSPEGKVLQSKNEFFIRRRAIPDRLRHALRSSSAIVFKSSKIMIRKVVRLSEQICIKKTSNPDVHRGGHPSSPAKGKIRKGVRPSEQICIKKSSNPDVHRGGHPSSPVKGKIRKGVRPSEQICIKKSSNPDVHRGGHRSSPVKGKIRKGVQPSEQICIKKTSNPDVLREVHPSSPAKRKMVVQTHLLLPKEKAIPGVYSHDLPSTPSIDLKVVQPSDQTFVKKTSNPDVHRGGHPSSLAKGKENAIPGVYQQDLSSTPAIDLKVVVPMDQRLLKKKAVPGVYRLDLPSSAINFSSFKGQELFFEAHQAGTMKGHAKLSNFFQVQSEPAFCGLASLCTVLNALDIDPNRIWKGQWRCFFQSMLDRFVHLEKVQKTGMSFVEVEWVAISVGAKVKAFRTNQSTIDDFRRWMIKCYASEDCYMISSYHREGLEQVGAGHFSPIGGYHRGKDMVLILDVASFKYPSHWVPLELLWKAMNTVDRATRQRRGFMIMSKHCKEPGLIYTLRCTLASLLGVAKYLADDVPDLLKSNDFKDFEAVLTVVFIPLLYLSKFEGFIEWVAGVQRQDDGDRSLNPEDRVAFKEQVLKQVQETGLFKHMVFVSPVNYCWRNTPPLGHKYDLPDTAAKVCCQGVETLSGKFGSSKMFCRPKTHRKHLKADGNKPVTLVEGGFEQGVGSIVPSFQIGDNSCASTNGIGGVYQAKYDYLAVFILALPTGTWSSIKDVELSQKILRLVSTENLPGLLKEEVLHLREQLQFLKRLQEKKK